MDGDYSYNRGAHTGKRNLQKAIKYEWQRRVQ